MPKLNGRAGNYEANEGIWIGAIKEAIARKLGGEGYAKTKPFMSLQNMVLPVAFVERGNKRDSNSTAV